MPNVINGKRGVVEATVKRQSRSVSGIHITRLKGVKRPSAEWPQSPETPVGQHLTITNLTDWVESHFCCPSSWCKCKIAQLQFLQYRPQAQISCIAIDHMAQHHRSWVQTPCFAYRHSSMMRDYSTKAWLGCLQNPKSSPRHPLPWQQDPFTDTSQGGRAVSGNMTMPLFP